METSRYPMILIIEKSVFEKKCAASAYRGIVRGVCRAWCVSRSERGDEAARLSSFLPIIPYLTPDGRAPGPSRRGVAAASLALSPRPSVSVRGPLGAWVRVLHGTLSVAVCVPPREPLTKYIFKIVRNHNSRLFIVPPATRPLS